MTSTHKATLAGLLFALSIWAANAMTQHWGQFALLITWGTLAAGVSLVARDWLFETAGRVAVFAFILAGAALSYWIGGGAFALASAVAFFVSETVDSVIYEPVARRRGKPAGVLASGMIAAPIDTLLFLWIAPLPILGAAIAGQWVVKGGISALAAALLAVRDRE